MKNNLQEYVIGGVLIILLLLLLNPFSLWMPDTLLMMVVAGLAIVFALFAGFMWREQAQDEREELLRHHASRMAYLVGAGALVLAVIVQSFQHDIDPWILVALGVMILAKVFGSVYSKSRN